MVKQLNALFYRRVLYSSDHLNVSVQWRLRKIVYFSMKDRKKHFQEKQTAGANNYMKINGNRVVLPWIHLPNRLSNELLFYSFALWVKNENKKTDLVDYFRCEFIGFGVLNYGFECDDHYTCWISRECANDLYQMFCVFAPNDYWS